MGTERPKKKPYCAAQQSDVEKKYPPYFFSLQLSSHCGEPCCEEINHCCLIVSLLVASGQQLATQCSRCILSVWHLENCEWAKGILNLPWCTTDQQMLGECLLALQRSQNPEEDEIVSFVSSPCFCFMEEGKEQLPRNLASYQATSRTKSQRFSIFRRQPLH